MSGKQKSKAKKILSVAVTVLLCIAAVLCFVTVVGSLVNDDPSVLGFRCFYVMTGSMEPTIHRNALVVTRRADSYAVGDVITFVSRDPAILGQSNTHRIIGVQETADGIEYVTKGDANPAADSYTVPLDSVFGKEVFHTGKAAWLGEVLDFVMNPKGFLLVIIVPVVLVVGSFLKDYVKTWKNAMEEMKEETRKELLAQLQAQGNSPAQTDAQPAPEKAGGAPEKAGGAPEKAGGAPEKAGTPPKITEIATKIAENTAEKEETQ